MSSSKITRDAGPARGTPLWWYLRGMTVAGLGVLGFGLSRVSLDDLHRVAWSPALWVLGVLVVFGQLRPIITPGTNDTNGATTSTTFAFAAMMYLGVPYAFAMQAVATVVAGMAMRRAPHRTLFNVAQYVLSLGAAALVFQLWGVSPSPAHPWVPVGTDLVPVAVAGAAYFAVNHVAVGLAVALYERSPLLQVLRSDLAYQILVNAALLSLAPLAVVVMDRSVALIPLFVLPLIAVYTNASESVRREHQANHDELTELPNRKLLVVRTEEVLAEARRRDHGAGLFLLDLDRFKDVNDTLGHPVGDRLLQIVAHRLTHSVRPGDMVARLGGDEFAVLLPRVRDAAAAREVANRLRAALSEPVRLDGLTFDLEASVGIALYPDHAPDFELLHQRADVAMYLAKETRSGVEVYAADKDHNSAERLSLLGDLRRAVDRRELELFFQPKVALGDRRLVGMEALVRWRHPTHGLIAPDVFLPLAEQSYLMRDITHQVVDTALAQSARWRDAGLPVQISVNVSARDLLDSGLSDAIAAGLLRHGVPPGSFQLEITERVLMTEPTHGVAPVDSLARLGISLALDDFGTGYSSLVRLKRLPVDEVKIDSSFVLRLLDGGDDAVIVRSLVDMVRALGMRSVAEGVETQAIASRLSAMGCDAAQGWYFGRPMDSATATSWLMRRLGSERPAGQVTPENKPTG